MFGVILLKILKNHHKIGTAAGMFAGSATLVMLIFLSQDALQGARDGLELCARSIIPSLLPFFIISSLLGELGLPRYLGKLAAPVMSRLFGVGGAGAAAFIVGLSGGYPLGAAAVADIYKRCECEKKESERLLAFCNNSGPAFVIGAAGIGIFGSVKIGLMLYAAHIAAALTVGIGAGIKMPRIKARRNSIDFKMLRFPEALSVSVKSSVTSLLAVCGFITFFSALISVLDGTGLFTFLAGRISEASGMSYGAARALLAGFLELGSGIGELASLGTYPATIALGAFILSWGGISVHCQTLAVTSGSELSLRPHTLGRLFCGVISAVFAYGLSHFC